MTIGIDANWLIYENSGIGRYSYELISALLKEDQKNRYILLANFVRHYQKRKEILENIVTKSGNNNVEIKITYFPSAWREKLISWNVPLNWLTRKSIDLYFTPYFSGAGKIPKGKKQIVTLYDMVYYRFPEHAGERLTKHWKRLTEKAIKNSDHIITISKSSKKDIIKYLKVDPQKITSTPISASNIFSYNPIEKKKNIILSVATLEPRKNLISLVKAYHLLPENIKKYYQLVLVGKIRWQSNELFEYIKANKLEDNIQWLGFIDDKKLAELYRQAKLFVYPSLFEGFGLPPLEAMQSGCPVLVSNNSSLPEIVANAGEYIDNPLDPNEIKSKIEKILLDNDYQTKLSKKGRERAKLFNWSKTAQETIRVFEKYNS